MDQPLRRRLHVSAESVTPLSVRSVFPWNIGSLRSFLLHNHTALPQYEGIRVHWCILEKTAVNVHPVRLHRIHHQHPQGIQSCKHMITSSAVCGL